MKKTLLILMAMALVGCSESPMGIETADDAVLAADEARKSRDSGPILPPGPDVDEEQGDGAVEGQDGGAGTHGVKPRVDP